MTNIKNFPAMTYSDVEAMDGDKVVEGYLEGFDGKPMPADRDKWHGWRNGMVDSGRAVVDEHQRKVAADYMRTNQAIQENL